MVFLCWLCFLLMTFLYKDFILFKIFKINNLFLDYLLFNEVYDFFCVYSLIIFSFSNYTSLVFLLFHILAFLKKGLYLKEYRIFVNYYLLCIFNSALSFILFNYLLFPSLLEFFIQLIFDQKVLDLFLELKALDYTRFYFNNFLVFIFLSLLLTTFVFSITIYVKVNQIKHFKRFMYLIFIVFITALIPPDVLIQSISFLMFICIFEIYVFLRCLIKKQLIW